MQSDTLKLAFTYTIAAVLIIGGLAVLVITRLDPPESNPQNLQLVIAGFVGAAIQFVFNRDSQTQTARATERAVAAGAAANAVGEKP
jgi:hypothetical protein